MLTDLQVSFKHKTINPVVNKFNIFWPDSINLTANLVNVEDIPSKDLNYAKSWLLGLKTCSLETDTLLFLKNMKNGDDWIIGCSNFCGVYVQIIDGRTITVLINDSIDISDTTHIEKRIILNISKYINLLSSVRLI